MKLLSVVVVPPLEGKLSELEALLSDLPLELLPLASVTGAAMPEPRADTLEALASARARAGARLCSALTLAEAQGLEVDALGGRPGVDSSCFAHEHATDAENNAALLRALDERPDAPRSARWCSVFALANPWQETVELASGICLGEIARAAEMGYGYASLFAVSEVGGRRLSDLSEEERTRVSSRRRAAGELRRLLGRAAIGQLDELRALVAGRA